MILEEADVKSIDKARQASHKGLRFFPLFDFRYPVSHLRLFSGRQVLLENSRKRDVSEIFTRWNGIFFAVTERRDFLCQCEYAFRSYTLRNSQ